MSPHYNGVITDEVKELVLKEHIDIQENIKKQKDALEDYNSYIAIYEYTRSLAIDGICEDVEAYASANGSYYELILFHLYDFLESFNYTKYIYLRFYNNIRSDAYYYASDGLNVSNLISAVNNESILTIFTNLYKSKETLAIFTELVSVRIKTSFIIHNYYRKNIKHPYIYKSNIFNYLLNDMIYDYTSILDKHIILSPSEYDGVFLNIPDIVINDTNIEAIDRNIYNISYERFVDLSFIITYYAEHFSRDGIRTLHTFYSNKMESLVIPQLYKVFLENIKNSKSIYNLYEKTKYLYSLDTRDEVSNISKDICPNIDGVIVICRCNYVKRLWRLIFNNANHHLYNYPEKRVIAKITDDIIGGYKL
jgi:hypothetical protein